MDLNILSKYNWELSSDLQNKSIIISDDMKIYEHMINKFFIIGLNIFIRLPNSLKLITGSWY